MLFEVVVFVVCELGCVICLVSCVCCICGMCVVGLISVVCGIVRGLVFGEVRYCGVVAVVTLVCGV